MSTQQEGEARSSDGTKRQSRRFVIYTGNYIQCDIIDSAVHRCNVATRRVQGLRRDASALGVNIGDSQHSTLVCGRGRAEATSSSTCIMTRLQPCTAVRGLCAMHRCGRANRGKATRAAKCIDASFTRQSRFKAFAGLGYLCPFPEVPNIFN